MQLLYQLDGIVVKVPCFLMEQFFILVCLLYDRLMPTPILATKLYLPPLRPTLALRPRLIKRLNEGLRQEQGFGRKLTLILNR